MIIPEIVLAPNIYAVEGREANVYFDSMYVSAADEYLQEVASSYGTHQNERWTWIPSGALASSSLTCSAIHPQTGATLASKTTTIKAAAASAGTGQNLACMFIGDSLISAGTITQTLLDIAGADAMDVTLLGTQGAGDNKHEGRSGWTVSTFVTTGSPFYISGAVNFPQYLVNNSVATPDWVFIHLGINDVFSQTTDATAIAAADAAFTSLDTLIASIKAAGAGVKVGLMIPSPPSTDQDAFGSNYASAQSRWRFKRNIVLWARQLLGKYNGQEANRIYVVPSNTALDTLNNMNRAAAAPINSRTALTSTRQSNGVHPATEGYRQIGDAAWAFLKCQV